MAQKSIYEAAAKRLIASELPKYYTGWKYHNKLLVIDSENIDDIDTLIKKNPWVKQEKLVAKPDQLFGKRGKANLILLGANWNEMKEFCSAKMNSVFEIGNLKGKLERILVEPFIPHDQEFYVSFTTHRHGDTIHFSLEGGIFIEENWDKVTHINVPFGIDIRSFDLKSKLPDIGKLGEFIIPFIKGLYQVFVDQDFTFLELNPFALTKINEIVPLDVKARIDDTAAFLHGDTWGNTIEFPVGFGQEFSDEEIRIRELDEKTGASLKLRILNPKGRIWTMVAGGGASVVYTDTIADLGFGGELGNYGEYSGNPTQEHTEIYAHTIINLMCKYPSPKGKLKYLIIGGGIANFTDIKATFFGITNAITKSAEKLKKNNVQIYVRRGGPNEKAGLELIRKVGEKTGIPIHVYDRYTHMTKVVELIKQAEE
ncbi:MAG: ATPase [Candidatus Lokiarchaeota archaeon]|nr:ATPase [Candidatus Lokiarchaeota archaeon]